MTVDFLDVMSSSCIELLDLIKGKIDKYIVY